MKEPWSLTREGSIPNQNMLSKCVWSVEMVSLFICSSLNLNLRLSQNIEGISYSIHIIFPIIAEEKGEIFRKSLRSERGSDSDDIEEISSDAENHRETKERKTDEDAVRESSERGRKESRKRVNLLQQFSFFFYTSVEPRGCNGNPLYQKVWNEPFTADSFTSRAKDIIFRKKCAVISSPPPQKKKNRDVIINIINYLKVVFSCLSFVRHLPNIWPSCA